jgi:SP family galactose:H+ symporter-like MFS transporter
LAIGSLAHWGFNAMIAFTFLKLVNTMGIDYTFWMYGLVCIAGLIWGYYYIPETKGKSLEEIENHWKAGDRPRDI